MGKVYFVNFMLLSISIAFAEFALHTSGQICQVCFTFLFNRF